MAAKKMSTTKIAAFILLIGHVECLLLRKIEFQPSINLDYYFSYQDISVVHFDVPEDAAQARFVFSAKEIYKSGIGNCVPRNVSLYLKSGSIPLVNADGSKNQTKLWKYRVAYDNHLFQSNEVKIPILKEIPAARDWYAIVFRSWQDPNLAKITQQGLGVKCDTHLTAELFVEQVRTVLMAVGTTNELNLTLNQAESSVILKISVPKALNNGNIDVKVDCAENCTIKAILEAQQVRTDHLMTNSDPGWFFNVSTGFAYRLLLRLTSGKAANVTVNFTKSTFEDTRLNVIPLLRKTKTAIFTFAYEYLADNQTKPMLVRVNAGNLTLLSFKLRAVTDIGGTLSFGLKLPNKTDDIAVVGCISQGYHTLIGDTGSCLRDGRRDPPDLWANDTKKTSIHIPYPEPGAWHLTLKAFRIASNCQCAKICATSACDNCSCMSEISTSVNTTISSSMCVEDQCEPHGWCSKFSGSKIAFTGCHCVADWRGLDCKDDTYVLTNSDAILQLLMLTLSNLAFILSVYMAIRREYYTEAIVYTSLLFFSTFYHACDAGTDSIGLCIMKSGILQFGDFFNALLAIWVTLVAMASFGQRLTAFCQLSGAVVIALSTEADRTALWVFLVPTIVGCALVATTWSTRCRRRGTYSYPASQYRNLYLPTGLCIVFVGLICYAFLQTRQNYYLLHSFWHVCVALGVVLLLPQRKYMK